MFDIAILPQHLATNLTQALLELIISSFLPSTTITGSAPNGVSETSCGNVALHACRHTGWRHTTATLSAKTWSTINITTCTICCYQNPCTTHADHNIVQNPRALWCSLASAYLASSRSISCLRAGCARPRSHAAPPPTLDGSLRRDRDHRNKSASACTSPPSHLCIENTYWY